jgi:putative peptidoglycan lipid II flippase
LLSRHAARGDRPHLGGDLTLGLRLVLFLAIPAGVGLILLAEPLARLLFERGQFTRTDTLRAARMIACYASGVWAYASLPVIVRGYYALGDRATPVRIGAAVTGLNLALNLMLIWPLAEAGLAVATAVAAGVQGLVLVVLFSRRKSPLLWPALLGTTVRTLVATLAMAAAASATLAWIPAAESLGNELLRVALPLGAAFVTYLAVYVLLGGREPRMLLSGLADESW